jgi:sodium-dependent dicarboxylate transporter 2/3/5
MSETAGTGFSWQKLALPVVMAALAYWLLRDFPTEQRHVGTIFALTVGLWMSEVMPLGITALVSSALLILAGGLNEK